MKSGLVFASFTLAGWLWLPQFALAQAQAPNLPKAPPEVVQPERSDPKACAPRQAETTGAPLGDKLAKTDGVICPPAGIDSEIRVPAPEAGGRTPVIPPPGSPGGDPTVQPN